jgi:hypothetical protein
MPLSKAVNLRESERRDPYAVSSQFSTGEVTFGNN